MAATYHLIEEIGTSAKSIGHANIQGLSQSSNALFENPASIDPKNSKSFSMFYTQFGNDINYANGSVYYNIPSIGFIGFGIMQTSIDGLLKAKEVNDEFVEDGTFAYLNRVIKLSYTSQKTRTYFKKYKIKIGASASYYSSTIDTITGKGNNMDIGIKINYPENQISIIGKNILPNKVSYSNQQTETIKESLVIAHQLSITNKPIKNLNLKLLSQVILSKHNIPALSGAITLNPYQLKFLSMSLGLRSYIINHTKTKTNPTLGISLNLKDLHFHYALEHNPATITELKNYFSIDYNIKTKKKPRF